jgi:mono/diheme cytochrome c family protein
VPRFLLGFVLGVAALPVAVLIAAWSGRLSTHANARPPAWEAALAKRALQGSAARKASHVTNPVAPTDENLLAGMKIFKGGCAGCHGDPNGNSDYGASFYPAVPQFMSHAPDKPDWQLFWIVKNGVRYSGMSAWDGQWGKDISDDNIWKVVTFLSRLTSLPPAVEAEWRKKQSGP